jgi:hypothetical protein
MMEVSEFDSLNVQNFTFSIASESVLGLCSLCSGNRGALSPEEEGGVGRAADHSG